MTEPMQELETQRGENLRIVPLDQFEEARAVRIYGLSVPIISLNGRPHLDALGRYWPVPQPRLWLGRAWARLARQ